MIRSVARLAFVFSLTWLAAGSAFAQGRLTDQGRVMVGGLVAGSYSPNAGLPTKADLRRWSVEVAPSAVYFLSDRIGLGGYAEVGHTRQEVLGIEGRDDITSTRWGLGVQALYEVALGERLGLFLVGSVGYEHITTLHPLRGTQAYTADPNAVQFGLAAPLTVHASDAVAFGFGPYARLQLLLPGAELQEEYGLSSAIFYSF